MAWTITNISTSIVGVNGENIPPQSTGRKTSPVVTVEMAELAKRNLITYTGYDDLLPTFRSVSELLVSRKLDFSVGQLVETQAEGYVYTVADPAATDQHITTLGGVKLYCNPNSAGEVVDAQFGAVANTDCTAIYQRIAAVLGDGAILRVAPGAKILNQNVTFTQNRFTIVGQGVATLMQASNTLSVDTLITLSGSQPRVLGITLDANLAGNPTASYTGRGELLRIVGHDARVDTINIVGSHVKDYACGLLILGNRATVTNVFGEGTGRVMIRGRGNNPILRNIVGRNVQPSADGIGNKIIAWDGGKGTAGGAFTTLLFDGVYGHSTNSGFYELIVVDDFEYASGLAIAKGLVADYPNATGPDIIKFVNCDVQIDGLHTTHAGDGSSNASLRFQWSVSAPGRVRRISLKGLDLAGHINFDDAQPAYVTVAGDCLIGRTLTGPVCIDDIPDGELVIANGATLQNFTASVLATRTDAFDASQVIGAINIVGASGGTPSSRRICNQRAYASGTPIRRISAAQVRIAEPLVISGTRVPADGRWVLDNEAMDASVLQGVSSLFMLSATDFNIAGPRDVDRLAARHVYH